ncbi:Uma2 family endonuclease [Kitasatospora sp. NPDC002227]|uniref:Uma2 family endonuclease n=1 Tax=Kitasatospora sp. NPDC002227 TaxID=3154773 RepID=UPI0033306EE0
MSAATHDYTEPRQESDDDLLEAFLALDTPEGFKAELIEGEIVVTPPPDGDHETAIGWIIKRIMRLCGDDIHVAGTKGLVLASDRYIPDLTFYWEGAFEGQPSWMVPNGVVMVVEVTSGRANKDREAKRRGYASAEVPLYLLVDRQRNEVVLHSEPQQGDYLATVRVPVGKPLPLPAPFGFELSTDRLT